MRAAIICAFWAAAAAPARAEEVEASTLWLVPSFIYEPGGSAPRRAEVEILNLSGETATVACYVYKETGELAERASQTKTYPSGASRSNEGGSLPCAFAFAESLRGWAVIVASQPVVARGFVCEGPFCPDRSPMPVVKLDCADPAPFAVACSRAAAAEPELKPEDRTPPPPADLSGDG
jgi:hypothetical protein